MVQLARPISDVAIGQWTTQAGGTTSLFDAINEVVADDADYMQSIVSPAADIVKVRLGSLSDPGSSTGHIIRYRYEKTGTDTIDLTVRLKQGSTEIASWAHTNVTSTYTDAAQTLTAPQADAITDYTSLDLWFEATMPLAGQVFRDLFTTAINPVTTPRTAEPGAGTWTVAGSLWKIVNGALRGGGQVTPTWGSSRLLHVGGLTRQAGRAMVAYVMVEDAIANLAVAGPPAQWLIRARTAMPGYRKTGRWWRRSPREKCPSTRASAKSGRWNIS